MLIIHITYMYAVREWLVSFGDTKTTTKLEHISTKCIYMQSSIQCSIQYKYSYSVRIISCYSAYALNHFIKISSAFFLSRSHHFGVFVFVFRFVSRFTGAQMRSLTGRLVAGIQLLSTLFPKVYLHTFLHILAYYILDVTVHVFGIFDIQLNWRKSLSWNK